MLVYLVALAVANKPGYLPGYCSSETVELVNTCLFVTDPTNCTAMHDTCYYSNYPACSDVIYIKSEHNETYTHDLVCFPVIDRSCFLNRVKINDEWHSLWRKEETGGHRRRRSSEEAEDENLQPAEIIFHHGEYCPELVSTCVRNTYITETESEGIYVVLFVFFGILLGSIVRFVITFTHLRLPYTSIIFFIGLVLAVVDIYYPESLGHISVAIRVVDNIDPHLLLGVFIPALIFESAFSTDYHIVKKEMASALLLAGPGVMMNTLITAGFAMLWPYDWDFKQALLFGCIVSATDPVAVVSLLRDLGASKQLATLIEGESLLNDGTAFVLFTVLVEFVKGENLSFGEVCSKFVVLVFGGVGIGILGALITTKWISFIYNDASIEISSSIWSCYLIFHIAEVEVGASGVLAVVFLGFFMSREKCVFSPEIEHSLHNVWGIISYLANTLIFLLAGIILIKVNLSGCGFTYIKWQDWFCGIGMYIGVHVSRLVTMLLLYPLLRRWGYGSLKLDLKQVWVITYGGLRGAIGLALALMTVQNSDIEQSFRARVVFHVSIIVLLTLFINATTIGYLIKYLGLTKLSEYQQMVVKSVFDHISEILERERRAMVISPKYSCADWRQVERMMPDYKKVFDPDDLDGVRTHRNKFPSLHENQKSCLGYCFNRSDKYERSPKEETPKSDLELADVAIFHSTPSLKMTVRNAIVAKRKDQKFMLEQVNNRLLMIMKAYWWTQFEEDLITEECVRILMEATDEAMDTNDLSKLVPFIENAFNIPTLLKLLYNSSWCTSLKCCRSLIEKLISHHLSLAIELAYEFVISTKRATIVLDRVFDEWIDDENTKQYVAFARVQSIGKLEEIVLHIRQLWLNSQKEYHDILEQIQTRRAVARLLHLENNILVELHHSGMVNETEKVRFQNEVKEKMLLLHNEHVLDHFKTPFSSTVEELARTMLLVQSFIPRQMTYLHQQEVVQILKLKKYKENEYIFKAGESEPCIVLITPPMSLAEVELNGVEDTIEKKRECFVYPGEIFSYDFLCNMEFSMSLKAITDVNVYKITKENLEEIYKGQAPEDEQLYRERLWELAAAQILTRFFPDIVNHASFSEVLKLVDSSILINITEEVDTFEIPQNKAFLLKGETVSPKKQDAPLILTNTGFPWKFTIGSIVLLFAYEPKDLLKHTIPLFEATDIETKPDEKNNNVYTEIRRQKEMRDKLVSIKCEEQVGLVDDVKNEKTLSLVELVDQGGFHLEQFFDEHAIMNRELSKSVKKKERDSRSITIPMRTKADGNLRLTYTS